MAGGPTRFQNGVNWVEALYPCLWAAAGKTGQDWKSFRKCPNVRDLSDPLASGIPARNARMSYALNYNLVEQPNAMVRDPALLMMFREMDRRVNSLLRPSIPSPDSTQSPLNAFLAPRDTALALLQPPDPNRHGTGSYICFADGHIRYFTSDYFPTMGSGSSAQSACAWDATDQRWYNVVDEADPTHNKTIAVSP